MTDTSLAARIGRALEDGLRGLWLAFGAPTDNDTVVATFSEWLSYDNQAQFEADRAASGKRLVSLIKSIAGACERYGWLRRGSSQLYFYSLGDPRYATPEDQANAHLSLPSADTLHFIHTGARPTPAPAPPPVAPTPAPTRQPRRPTPAPDSPGAEAWTQADAPPLSSSEDEGERRGRPTPRSERPGLRRSEAGEELRELSSQLAERFRTSLGELPILEMPAPGARGSAYRVARMPYTHASAPEPGTVREWSRLIRDFARALVPPEHFATCMARAADTQEVMELLAPQRLCLAGSCRRAHGPNSRPPQVMPPELAMQFDMLARGDKAAAAQRALLRGFFGHQILASQKLTKELSDRNRSVAQHFMVRLPSGDELTGWVADVRKELALLITTIGEKFVRRGFPDGFLHNFLSCDKGGDHTAFSFGSAHDPAPQSRHAIREIISFRGEDSRDNLDTVLSLSKRDSAAILIEGELPAESARAQLEAAIASTLVHVCAAAPTGPPGAALPAECSHFVACVPARTCVASCLVLEDDAAHDALLALPRPELTGAEALVPVSVGGQIAGFAGLRDLQVGRTGCKTLPGSVLAHIIEFWGGGMQGEGPAGAGGSALTVGPLIFPAGEYLATRIPSAFSCFEHSVKPILLSAHLRAATGSPRTRARRARTRTAFPQL